VAGFDGDDDTLRRVPRTVAYRRRIALAATAGVAAAAIIAASVTVANRVGDGRPDGALATGASPTTPAATITPTASDTQTPSPPAGAETGPPSTAPLPAPGAGLGASELTLTRADWGGTLPSAHPSRFVAEYKTGIALFSATDGRLLRMLAGPREKGCRLYLAEVRTDGRLIVGSTDTVNAATVEEETCKARSELAWSPSTGWGTLEEQFEEESNRAGMMSARVSFGHTEGSLSGLISWDYTGRESTQTSVNAMLREPDLSSDGRLAVTAIRPHLEGHDRSGPFLLVMPFGDTGNGIARVIPPEGADTCNLGTPHWVTATDSTGAAADLLLVVQSCWGEHPGSQVLVTDPARGELLGTVDFADDHGVSSPLAWSGGATIYARQGARDTTGPVVVLAGGKPTVLDTSHPTKANDCSSVDPVRPCAANPLWVPDDWGQ